MALKDRKITEAGIAAHGVVSAPDRLTGTAAENKKVFDKLIRNVVAECMNGMVDDLVSTQEGASGAAQIGISPVEGVEAKNVQEALQALRTDPAVAAVKAQQAAEEALKAAAEAQSVAEETAEKAKTDAATALKELTQTAEKKVDEVSQLVTSAKSWAVGGTESREGEEEDNARYWSQQARKATEDAAKELREELGATASVVTMLAANWSGNVYSFEEAYPSTQYDISIEVAPTAIAEQFEAFGAAMICGSADSNVATAIGGAPTIDIPIIIKAVKK